MRSWVLMKMKVKIIKPKSVLGKAKYMIVENEYINGYLIPKGFVTDGATVPRPFWWLFPPVSSYFDATVLHDYLLKSGKVGRYKADLLFLNQMESDGVSVPVRYTMFCIVLIYGFVKTAGYVFD